MFLKLSLAHHCHLYGIVHIYLCAKALRGAKLTKQLLSVTLTTLYHFIGFLFFFIHFTSSNSLFFLNMEPEILMCGK